MIDSIFEFFRGFDQSNRPNDDIEETALHLVSASLLAEVMLIDGDDHHSELETTQKILRDNFALAPEEIDSLMAHAENRSGDATSLFEFTDQINRHFSSQQKSQLISHLWQVAYADGVIHKLEEATIRKIAELIYVPHSQFIKAKLTARTR